MSQSRPVYLDHAATTPMHARAIEAMTAARPYRMTPLTAEQALGELRKFAGVQFDPKVVDAFTQVASAEGEGFIVNSALKIAEAAAAECDPAQLTVSSVAAALRLEDAP